MRLLYLEDISVGKKGRADFTAQAWFEKRFYCAGNRKLFTAGGEGNLQMDDAARGTRVGCDVARRACLSVLDGIIIGQGTKQKKMVLVRSTTSSRRWSRHEKRVFHVVCKNFYN